MNTTSQTILMQSGPIFVTEKILGFRGHRYKIRHIENLILRRPLFLMGIALSILIAGFMLINADLLYWYEQIIFGIAAILAIAATWPLGTLEIHSRTLNTSQGSITWLHKDLAAAQDQVEAILSGEEGASLSITNDEDAE